MGVCVGGASLCMYVYVHIIQNKNTSTHTQTYIVHTHTHLICMHAHTHKQCTHTLTMDCQYRFLRRTEEYAASKVRAVEAHERHRVVLCKRHIRQAPDWKAWIQRIYEHLGHIEDVELHLLFVECHTLNRVCTSLQDGEITRRQEELLGSTWEKGREGWREGGEREEGMEGGREGGREGGSEEETERWREGREEEGGRKKEGRSSRRKEIL